ncbi:uncharacterized protein [Palaemon carinicauda]|uniref:uncharacterized protein isoform X2 n=1 Tax=Palaemon carinicauda TaxID=392227 RepID=UPI0035B69652
MAYLFTQGRSGGGPKINLSDCRYEEEQELAQTARRFMKKRDKERAKQLEKERLKAEKKALKAEKKVLKALQKATKDQLAAESPLLLGKDPQMAEGSRVEDGKGGNIGPGEDKRHTDRRSERQSERRSEKQVDGQTSTQKSPTRLALHHIKKKKKCLDIYRNSRLNNY